MASEIRVNKINSQTGVGTITLSPTGVDISGITTAATLKVGTGVTVSSDGDIFATGISTFTGLVDANGGAHIDNLRLGIDADNDITTSAGNLTLDSAGGNVVINDNLDVDGTTTVDGDFSIADKIVHTGDTDTAIRFPANDNITFETAGSQRALFDSSGNLGIGEGNPANLLHVKVSDTGVNPHSSAQIVLERSGTNYLQFLTTNTGTSGILFGDGDDADVTQIKYDHNIPAMQFQTEGAERLRINSSGDLLYASNDRNYAFWYKSPTNASSNAASTSAEVLTFGTAILANSAYNTSNGRYTAPIDGLYFIRFNGLLDNNAGDAGHRASIYVNGAQYGDRIAYHQIVTGTNNGVYLPLSGSGIVYMSANDYAQIHCTAGIHVSGETQVLGYLIRATV